MTLGKAYDDIMEKVEVTEEMRRRVLEHIAEEDITPARSKVVRFPAWKKYLSAAACLVLVIAGAAALPRLLAPEQPEPPIQVVPDIVEVASPQEMSELVGFVVNTDFALPFEVEQTTYCSYWGELAQVTYSGQEQTATFRQSVGDEDNSGDYTSYGETIELTVNGQTVTLKGDGSVYALALWADGEFSCSLRLSDGIPKMEWVELWA